MKQILLPIAFFVGSSLVAIASVALSVSPGAAQDQGVQSLNSALSYPTSSERFFRAGQQQLEQEIQRLQQGSNAQATDVLRIEPTVYEQQRDWQRQQDQQFLDRVGTPQRHFPNHSH